MATIIRRDGTRTEVQPKNGTDFQLAELREIVGGYVEIVRVPDPKVLWIVDDEGALKPDNLNPEATRLYREAFGIEMPYYQHDLEMAALVADPPFPNMIVIDATRELGYEPYSICGDVLICDASQIV